MTSTKIKERDPWIVNIFGGPEETFEISVVREGNKHGRLSYGWFHHDDKLLIAKSFHQFSVEKIVWRRLLIVAAEVAAELNNGERVFKLVPRITFGSNA